MSNPPSVPDPTIRSGTSPVSTSIWSLLLTAIWFGVVTGLVEGAGLLLFQRINWARWGPMTHVSFQILWVSPIVDVTLFACLALAISCASWLLRRINAFQIVGLLTFLALFDWLTLTDRLRPLACVILSLGITVSLRRWLRPREGTALRFWRKTAPWTVAIWLLTFAGVEGGRWAKEQNATANLPKADASSPNVLVIVVDTLRADHVSAYGYPRRTTPNLDKLASQGVLFENAIAPCSWSLPSHVSLVTGRYQFEHGVESVQPEPWLGWGNASFRGYPTLGEALEKSGYRTGAFSANRIYFTGNLGFGRAFLHFEDYFHSAADAFVRTLYGREFARRYLSRSDKSLVHRMLLRLHFTSLVDRDTEGWVRGSPSGVRKRAAVVNAELLHWIDRGRQRPFFAFLNYMDVHHPYGAPVGYPHSPWNHGTAIDNYDEGLRFADDSIGHLLADLEQRGLAQKTLIIVTSDHGESLGQHELTYHASALYWELIHVPLLIWYPGHVPIGLRVARPVSIAAIPGTVLDLARSSQRTLIAGPPLSSLWTTPAAESPDPLSELAKNEIIAPEDRQPEIPNAFTGSMRSIVTPHWHLITHEKMGNQLYDWVHDPGELNKLINTPEGRSAAAKLAVEMDSRTKSPR
jgi:arylsulfatase A-like enzyme